VQDIGGFLNALRSIGYDGPVVPEPFDANLKKLPPEEAVELTGQAMRRIWSMPAATPLPGTMQVIATGGRKAWLVEQPVPTPQGHEVIVKVYASPICGSNLGGFLKEGTVINDGHEGAGEVVAVAQSNLLKVGDRVALAPLNACGRCEHCRRGDAIYCTHRPTIYGAFAQFIRVADVLCIPIPPDLDYARASLLGCCLGPAYQAIKRLNVRAFDTVVITGLGPVGLGALALCSFLGAKALALDTVPYRLELARQMGAAVALQADAPDLAAQLRVAVGEPGLLRAIECSGQERALRLLIDSAGVGAQIAMIGENHDPVPIRPSEDFIRKGLTLTGCWHMNVNDAPDLIRFLQRRPELADKLISHRFGLGGVQQAFDTFASRQSAKVVVMPWEK
jgi:threonine dehydrogenase-like Zn-dependent dehydrogenase